MWRVLLGVLLLSILLLGVFLLSPALSLAQSTNSVNAPFPLRSDSPIRALEWAPGVTTLRDQDGNSTTVYQMAPGQRGYTSSSGAQGSIYGEQPRLPLAVPQSELPTRDAWRDRYK